MTVEEYVKDLLAWAKQWAKDHRECRSGPHIASCGPAFDDTCACGCRGDEYACWADDEYDEL